MTVLSTVQDSVADTGYNLSVLFTY